MDDLTTKLKNSIYNHHANLLTLLSGCLGLIVLLTAIFSSLNKTNDPNSVDLMMLVGGARIYKFYMLVPITLVLVHIAYRMFLQFSAQFKLPAITFIFESTLYVLLTVNYIMFMIFGHYIPVKMLVETGSDSLNKLEGKVTWFRIISGVAGICMALEIGVLIFVNIFNKQNEENEENEKN